MLNLINFSCVKSSKTRKYYVTDERKGSKYKDKVVFLLVITLTFSVFLLFLFVISAAKQVGAAPTSFKEHEKAFRGEQ